MNKEFNDIFESINLMHKKYSSKDYLENIDKLTSSSKDLEQILEKYNIYSHESKSKKNKVNKRNR